MRNSWTSVKVKIFLGYLFLIIISFLSIRIIYSEISRLSHDKSGSNIANEKVMRIGNLLNNLYQAEALERTYLETGNTVYYSRYALLMDTIRMQIDSLYILADDPIQQMHTDSIRILFDKKINNLRELASIKEAGSSEDLYRRAMLRLTYNQDSIDHFMHVYKTVTTSRDSIYVKQRKKNFLNRLVYVFSPQEERDSTLQVNVNQSVRFDSIMGAFNPADSVSGFLTAIMKDIREESFEIENQLAKKEQDILANTHTISFQLRQILSIYENEEYVRSLHKLYIIRQRTKQTTWFIVILGITALVTIVIFLFFILRDIGKSQHYRRKLEKEKAYSEALLKSKEQLMLAITHDLKSPVGSVTGYARLLRNTANKELKDNYLENIEKANGHILKLINDLVDLSKLETGKLSVEHIRYNLKQLVDEIYMRFYPQTLSKNLEFRLEYHISLNNDYRGDPVRIKQVLENLLSNAFKFTEKGKIVLQVSLFESYRNTHRIKFEIRDTGIGIRQNEQKHIFEEFSRGELRNSDNYEGAGLGLTISKRITELLNGTISLKSRPNVGSQFTVLLPLEISGTAEEDAVPISNEKILLKDKRVLLIDDDEILLHMIAETLRNDGMRVFVCNRPTQALHVLERNTFDLIISDIYMPSMTGIELIKHIKRRTGDQVPVVAVTGQGSSKSGVLKNAGFTACLYKPFSPDELLKCISEVLSGRTFHPEGKNGNSETEKTRANRYSLNMIRQFAGNDSQNLHRILESFVTSSYDQLIVFREYLNEGNVKDLSILAHKMLSMYRQLEAFEIVGPLSKLERTEPWQSDNEQWLAQGEDVLLKISQLLELICEEQKISVKS